MEKDVELACRCGKVHGALHGASRASVNRATCYCQDCQAFLHHLGREDLLDEAGGTDIVQAAPAAVTFDRGEDQIACVRLSPKGMFRFYARCCNTPLGNTVQPSVPFIGMPAGMFPDGGDAAARDALFGASRGAILTEGATKPVAKPGLLALARMGAHVVGRLGAWKLGGKAFPHPFFEKGAPEPRFPVVVLTPAQRDALRVKTGPRASDASRAAT